MPISHVVLRAALAAALVVPVAACNDGTGSDTAPVSVLLTDAPGDFKAAVVTISEVYLQGDGGRVVLMDEPTTVNLLDLRDATVTLVAEIEIPEGRYAQLRFVITGGYLEVETDDGGSAFYASAPDYAGLPEGTVITGHLQMPSFDASGLKVVFPNGALEVSGDGTQVLADFDAQQSYGHATGGDGWVLSPVIHGTELATE